MATHLQAALGTAAVSVRPPAEATPATPAAPATSAAGAGRLGECEVCAKQTARYCCPKCEVKTCCLACVRIHKRELNCDGIRDRTKFIPMRRMTDRDFMSDYYFLEECTRYVEDRKNDKLKRYTRFNKELPLHLQRLRKAAQQRRTRLLFLLQHFTRHTENTTYLNWKERRIYWRIEWRFVNALTSGQQQVHYVDAHCNEEKTLAALIAKYLEEMTLYKELAYYQSAGLGALKLLLRAERMASKQPRYYLLDASETLRENLAGKTIIEYPCICVSYETVPAGFDIIDSDEEEHKEGAARSSEVEIPPTKRRKQNTASTNTNLLITDESPSDKEHDQDEDEDADEDEHEHDKDGYGKNADDVLLPTGYIVDEREDCFSDAADDVDDDKDNDDGGHACDA